MQWSPRDRWLRLDDGQDAAASTSLTKVLWAPPRAWGEYW